MATIGLVIRPGVKEAALLGLELVKWAEERSYKLLAEERTAALLDLQSASVRAEKLAKVADPIVTLGGDGTLIGVARYVQGKGPIILGVNFGNLGFLTEISPEELFSTLESVLLNKAEFGERNLLQADVYRGNKRIFSSAAVNDAVIQKGVRERLLDLDLTVNEQAVMRMRADGLIIATPTGSTAYSLSAGGSIVHPSLDVVLLSPICPHSLTNRPLILPLDFSLKVNFPPYDGELFLSVDGQESTALLPSDEVRVTRSPNTVRFVRSSNKSYFDILRTKLNWGLGNEFN